jgi:hypothetical protein
MLRAAGATMLLTALLAEGPVAPAEAPDTHPHDLFINGLLVPPVGAYEGWINLHNGWADVWICHFETGGRVVARYYVGPSTFRATDLGLGRGYEVDVRGPAFDWHGVVAFPNTRLDQANADVEGRLAHAVAGFQDVGLAGAAAGPVPLIWC